MALSQEELDDAKAQQGPDSYEQEFECSFEAAIRGSYYVEELQRATEQTLSEYWIVRGR
jgi:phage terminase large subunit